MGECVYTAPDGQEWCEPMSRPGACDVGGVYDDGTCSSICFFVTELTSYMSAKSDGDLIVEVTALPGVMIAQDFRAVILRHSALGREAVDLYATDAKAAVEAMRKHPKLLWRALRLVTKGIRLAQDILRSYSLKEHGVVTGMFKLDHDTVREVFEVSSELRKLSPTKDSIIWSRGSKRSLNRSTA